MFKQKMLINKYIFINIIEIICIVPPVLYPNLKLKK